MTAPCPTCQALIADCLDDTALYSLESSLFPFVFQCPEGFDCSDPSSFRMVCCGQQFSVDFPPGIDADTKQTVIQSIVNQCAAILPTCGQTRGGCATPPCDTVTLFYNRDATCSIKCPDGTDFVYTVVAGTFAALTQQDADAQALAFACEQVGLRRVCMGNFASCLCVGSDYSRNIPVSGGIGPFLFNVVSGSLPPGLGLSIFGNISGTPTVSGNFAFGVRVVSGGGGSVTKQFRMSVLEIITTELPAFTIGVPYDYQMLGAGGSGNYLWKIVSGTLPPGLIMDNTGHITGTPT